MRRTRAARVASVTRVPSTRTSPASGMSRPRMSRSTVDLPEPLEPRSTCTVPAATSSDTSSRATRSPKRLVTPRSSITTRPAPAFSRSAGGGGSANHPRGPERRDLGRGQLEDAAQHLLRMLAQRGRGGAHRARRLGEAYGHADHAHFARARMAHLHEGPARLHLRVIHDLGDSVDGAEGDALVEEDRLPLLVRTREEGLLERGDERLAVLRPLRVRPVARVVGELGPADGGAEDLPELLAAHGEGKIARLRPERLVGEERLVGGAHGLGHLAVGEIAANHGAEERELALEHRHVDSLAAARPLLHAQGERDAVSRVHPRRHVRDGRAAAHAVRARLAGDGDHPALRLEDEIESGAVPIRAVLTEAGDGAIDDAGVSLARHLIAEAEALEGARAIVLEHHVRALHEPEEELLAARMLEVDLDPLLVAMQAHEVRGLSAGQPRPPRARDVPRALGLELDHLCAEVGEHGRAERSGQRVAQIEDAHPFERHLHQRPPATDNVWPVT